MSGCCFPSMPACRPGPRSSSSPAVSMPCRWCSGPSAAWSGGSCRCATSKPDNPKEPCMRARRSILAAGLAAAFALSLHAAPAFAQESKMPVIATFSILADLVKNVGGDRVEITTLVGPNSDAHVYAPTPADAKKVAGAKVVFVNGLGFEGWMTRLVKASGTKAPTVTASNGVKSRKMEEEGHKVTDPHAWQSIANTKLYVANIRDGLAAADPAGKSTYDANANAYLAKLDALETEVKDAIGRIASDRRRIITSHDAFGYFGAAY